MDLKSMLARDLKEAMKAKDKVKKSVVTLVRTAIKQKEVDERVELKDEDVINIISKQLKQRKDALVDFEKAKREDLISETKKEIDILLSYLPKQLTDGELEEMVQEAVDNLKATSVKDMGKIMGYLMPKVKGRADGKRINKIVNKILNK